MKTVIAKSIILSLSVLVSFVNADVINYGNLESPGMTYSNITESSVHETLPLFGSPSMDGNALVFDNPNFQINLNSNSLDFIDGRMTATVTAKGNQQITSFRLLEFGSYALTGSDSIASVSAIGFASFGNQTISRDFLFVAQNSGSGEWERQLEFEFDTPVSTFDFVLDNQLFASAGDNSSATIFKEGIELRVNAIPEPSTTMIAATMIVSMLARRKR